MEEIPKQMLRTQVTVIAPSSDKVMSDYDSTLYTSFTSFHD